MAYKCMSGSTDTRTPSRTMSGSGDAPTSPTLAEPGERSDVPEGTCSVDGCERAARSRSLCALHYKRWWRHGDPLVTLVSPWTETADRVWSSFRRRSNGCWEWTAATSPEGYGRLGGHLYAHRVMYELIVGPIPEGLHIDHLCRNRACVNPSHLEPVTSAENLRRGLSYALRPLGPDVCLRGHEFTQENTYTRPGTAERVCKTCKREAQRRAPKNPGAAKQARADRAERLRRGEVEVVHGSASTYNNWSCRCDECRASHAERARLRKAAS